MVGPEADLILGDVEQDLLRQLAAQAPRVAELIAAREGSHD
ncbi:MAG TPA: hypothetical protein VLK82_02750 [Candidatus Tectomicrobia bacterium]|nr:hypothetical protein [Candidatus Tectomicrobia bacterium]